MDLEKPIDITKDSLIKVALIENDILMIKINHFISDGYSYGILINELFKIYNNEILEALPIQYSDFAYYYDKKINSEDYTEQIKYYSSIFNAPYSNVKLSTTNNNNDDKFKYKFLTVKSDTEFYNNVNRIIRETNISKTTLFLAIYCIVMSAYSGHDNIFVDMFNTNRTNTDTEKLIGYFVKFTPILVKMENINLINFLIKYKNILLTLFSYDVPYTTISDELKLPKCNLKFKFDPYELYNKNELNYMENIDRNDIYKMLGKGDLPYNEFELNRNSNSYVLSFTVTEREDHYNIGFSYNKGTYDEILIENIINSFIDIIKNENCINESLQYIIEYIKNKNNNSSYNNKNFIKSIQSYENKGENSSENTDLTNNNENINDITEITNNNDNINENTKTTYHKENLDDSYEILNTKDNINENTEIIYTKNNINENTEIIYTKENINENTEIIYTKENSNGNSNGNSNENSIENSNENSNENSEITYFNNDANKHNELINNNKNNNIIHKLFQKMKNVFNKGIFY